MITLQFFTRKDCELCHYALAVVQRVQRRVPFHLETIDIDSDPALGERYGSVIPVITSGNHELARSFVDEKKFVLALQKERLFQ